MKVKVSNERNVGGDTEPPDWIWEAFPLLRPHVAADVVEVSLRAPTG